MKICTKCKKEKDYSEFNENKAKKDGYQIICKNCNREYSRNYYKANKKQLYSKLVKYTKNKQEGVYSVYLLPVSNYVGMTKNVFQRMCFHRNAQKRDTSNYIIIAQFKDKEDALNLEREYHNKGFAGVNKWNKRYSS